MAVPVAVTRFGLGFTCTYLFYSHLSSVFPCVPYGSLLVCSQRNGGHYTKGCWEFEFVIAQGPCFLRRGAPGPVELACLRQISVRVRVQLSWRWN